MHKQESPHSRERVRSCKMASKLLGFRGAISREQGGKFKGRIKEVLSRSFFLQDSERKGRD
jgi:hypothetical protein